MVWRGVVYGVAWRVVRDVWSVVRGVVRGVVCGLTPARAPAHLPPASRKTSLHGSERTRGLVVRDVENEDLPVRPEAEAAHRVCSGEPKAQGSRQLPSCNCPICRSQRLVGPWSHNLIWTQHGLSWAVPSRMARRVASLQPQTKPINKCARRSQGSAAQCTDWDHSGYGAHDNGSKLPKHQMCS